MKIFGIKLNNCEQNKEKKGILAKDNYQISLETTATSFATISKSKSCEPFSAILINVVRNAKHPNCLLLGA